MLYGRMKKVVRMGFRALGVVAVAIVAIVAIVQLTGCATAKPERDEQLVQATDRVKSTMVLPPDIVRPTVHIPSQDATVELGEVQSHVIVDGQHFHDFTPTINGQTVDVRCPFKPGCYPHHIRVSEGENDSVCEDREHCFLVPPEKKKVCGCQEK